jgi:hypothetical protein
MAKHDPPPILITDLGAPPAEPTGGFRLWERAVLGFAPLSAAAPLICCATFGRAGWSVLALVAAPVGLLSVAIVRGRRDSAPEVPVSAPGWSATWSDHVGTVVRGERAA